MICGDTISTMMKHWMRYDRECKQNDQMLLFSKKINQFF
jgi:hypothetical protein